MIRSVPGLNLAATDPVAAAAAYTAHYDKIACEFPEIAAIYDFRHSLCRPSGTITTATRFKNLVKGGADLIPTMVPGLSLRPNALRFNGGTFPATNQAQCKLDDTLRPTQSIKQFGWLAYFTPVGLGTASSGLIRAGIGTSVNGLSATLPTSGNTTIPSRVDNGTSNLVYPETAIFPYTSVAWALALNTPMCVGNGYYNAGTTALASLRTSTRNGVATALTYTNDDSLTDIDPAGTDFFIGHNGINQSNGTIFDLHRLVIVRMTTTPVNPFRLIAKRDWELYGAGVLAGYTP